MPERRLGRRGFMEGAVGLPLVSSFGAKPGQSCSDFPGGAEIKAAGQLNYHPRGLYVWDSWYFTRGDEVHVIHLQKLRPGSDRAELDGVSLGHAISTDMLTWTELPVALRPGPEGSIDDWDLFTGCTHFHAGLFYLFYTARKKSERGQIQRLCVATSEDAVHWEKQPAPIIEPDTRWYEQGDCRDLMVVQHPDTKEFHGFFTARIQSPELVQTAVIGHATSPDLLHWEQGPPVFAPQEFGILEEPDVFSTDGRWWLICATGNFDGVRGNYGDPNLTYGTVYASSRNLDGPYQEGEDNLFLGSTEFNGFSCRTFEWKNRRYVMYSQAERQNGQDHAPSTLGCLSTPKEVKVSPGGHLCPMYSPLIESRVQQTLIDGKQLPQLQELPYEMAVRRFGTPGEWEKGEGRITARSLRSWSVRTCGDDSDSFIWSGTLRLEKGRAIGLLFKDNLAVYLDFTEESVTFTTLPILDRIERRKITLKYGEDYHLRIVAKSEFIEAYVDDVLLLNFVRYQPRRGKFGLFVEAGFGTFANLRAVSIRS